MASRIDATLWQQALVTVRTVCPAPIRNAVTPAAEAPAEVFASVGDVDTGARCPCSAVPEARTRRQ